MQAELEALAEAEEDKEATISEESAQGENYFELTYREQIAGMDLVKKQYEESRDKLQKIDKNFVKYVLENTYLTCVKVNFIHSNHFLDRFNFQEDIEDVRRVD
jgi:uncharacterized radical SAM superfamily Fe-S cluster-containing enzyme